MGTPKSAPAAMFDVVDPQIERASTLPSAFYTDPDLFERSKDAIFARSWQFIGDGDLVRVPTAVHPFTLLPGCLDEPLLLTRDAGDRIHLLSNVCTHRGFLVSEHGGCTRSLRCRYHGRRFDLDGRFRSMPEFDRAECFPSESDSLPKVPWGRWGRFLFATLGATPLCGLDELLADVERRLGWLPTHEFTFDPQHSRDYRVQANWALYCDNYLEGFHIPFVHASLDQALDYGNYRSEIFEWSNLQIGAPSGDTAVFDLPPESPDHGREIAAYYYWLFPNTMLNFYPWGLSVNVVQPLAVDRTKVSFLSWVWDPSKLVEGAGADLDRVEREDEAVVEGVQRGLRSRFYNRGRFSPSREQGVHHFHRLLSEALA